MLNREHTEAAISTYTYWETMHVSLGNTSVKIQMRKSKVIKLDFYYGS